jgi:divalent metal cation (Fe/Co/Zn/Cd) transporter
VSSPTASNRTIIIALGAGVSIYEGILHIAEPEHAGSPTVAYVVLLIAFLLDGWSTMEAFREFKEAKGNSGWIDAIRRSKDPAGFIVLLENGAAMAGIVVAAAGLALAQATADPFYDGAASVVIGLILGITAFFLAYESKALLIGEAADPEIVRALHEMVEARDGVSSVGEVLTVHSAPDQITAMLSVDFVDTMTAREVEALVCSVELEAEKRFPIIRRLYIRPRSPADQGPCS